VSEGYRPDEKETGPSVSDHLQVLEDHKHGYETYTTRTLRRLLKESEARALAAEKRLAEVEAVLRERDSQLQYAEEFHGYTYRGWKERQERLREQRMARAVLKEKHAEEERRE